MKLNKLRFSNDEAYLSTDDIRQGNHNLCDIGKFINGLRAPSSAQTMNVILPNGTPSQAYGEGYHGGWLTPSYGVNIYNAAGQQVAFAANNEIQEIPACR